MKPVAPDALPIKRVGDREMIGELRMAAMRSGVKASHLKQVRQPLKNRANWRQVVGLVQRRQWDQALEPIEDRPTYDCRLAVVGAAVHHPVTDCARQLATELASQKGD